MLSVIKTAIITITLSFISGVLLDRYKNTAPRILCHMAKCVPIKLGSKKIKVYVLTIRNVSKQTIHNLNLNLRGKCADLKIEDTKITNGLKFDISNESNVYDISIPFLSRNDEFSLKVLLEGSQNSKDKPIVALRSPENFKRIDSGDGSGFVNSIKSIPENISDYFSKQKNSNKINNAEKKLFRDKKVIITIASIILLVFAGVLVTRYCKINDSNSTNVESSNEKVNSCKEKDNSGNSSGNLNTSSNEKSNTPGKSENSSKQGQSSGTQKNSEVNSNNSQSNKNEGTSKNQNLGTDSEKNNKGEDIDKKNNNNSSVSSSNSKNNGNSKNSSEGNNKTKSSDSKSNFADGNKSVNEGSSNSSTGTSASNTP